jgi:hypothetical protein
MAQLVADHPASRRAGAPVHYARSRNRRADFAQGRANDLGQARGRRQGYGQPVSSIGACRPHANGYVAPRRLSENKALYIRDLARHFVSASLIRANGQRWMTALIVLTAVHGIGRWTAEMFLMFHSAAGCPALADIGLRRRSPCTTTTGRESR